jgi:hypothetical protein
MALRDFTQKVRKSTHRLNRACFPQPNGIPSPTQPSEFLASRLTPAVSAEGRWIAKNMSEAEILMLLIAMSVTCILLVIALIIATSHRDRLLTQLRT